MDIIANTNSISFINGRHEMRMKKEGQCGWIRKIMIIIKKSEQVARAEHDGLNTVCHLIRDIHLIFAITIKIFHNDIMMKKKMLPSINQYFFLVIVHSFKHATRTQGLKQ